MLTGTPTWAFNFQDGTLFGNDAGEDEDPEVLSSYFVDQAGFSEFLSENTTLQIARSRKGMGKSALLSKMNFDMTEKGELTVKLTGSQLIDESIPQFKTLLEAQNFWVSQICSRINGALGSLIGFAFSDTQMSLVEAAEIAGLRERSLVGALLSRIKIKKLPIELTPLSKEVDPEALLTRALEKNINRRIWLFIDDVDASFQNTPDQQLLISSFFSACRFIAREMKGVYLRTTVRSDVWSNLGSNEDLDKCEQYIADIHWTKSELKSILAKKVYAWMWRQYPEIVRGNGYSVGEKPDELVELAFDRRVRWGGHSVHPFQPINILSAGRPRWMSQLCRLAGREAAKRGKGRIGISDINTSMKNFTRYRVADLYKEHRHQFSQLEKLIQTFAGGPVRYSAQELMSRINKMFIGPVGVRNISAIDGEPYSSPLQLANLLYKTGFLLARDETPGWAGGVRYISYSEDPELLSHSGNLQPLMWEIYPSYRQLRRVQDIDDGLVGEPLQIEDSSAND